MSGPVSHPALSRPDERVAGDEHAHQQPRQPEDQALVDLRKRRTRDAERRHHRRGVRRAGLALDAGVMPRQLFYAPDLVGRRRAGTRRASRAGRSRGRHAGAGRDAEGVLPRVVRRLAGRRRQPGPPARRDRARAPTRWCWSARRSRSPATSAPWCVPPRQPASMPSSPRPRSPTGATPTSSARARRPCSRCRSRPRHRRRSWPGCASTSIQIVVATPETDRELGGTDLRAPTAVVVGAEHDGISADWLDGGRRRGRAADGRAGQLAQRRHVGSDLHLRGSAPARPANILNTRTRSWEGDAWHVAPARGGHRAEVTATLSLKFTEGFTKVGPIMVVIAGYPVVLLAGRVLDRGLPLSVVYAIWSAIGIAVLALIDTIWFEEKLSALQISGCSRGRGVAPSRSARTRHDRTGSTAVAQGRRGRARHSSRPPWRSSSARASQASPTAT